MRTTRQGAPTRLVDRIDMVNEMIEGADGHDPEALWLAIAELDRERTEIEADVFADGGMLDVSHEWSAFLVWAEAGRQGSM